MKDMIRIQNVNKCFNHRVKDREVYALDILNFSIKKNEFFCILGPSGCGKSTLLNLLAGFEKPTNGKILIKGSEVEEPNPKNVTMFQEHALFPWRNVLHNVAYGLEVQGVEKEKRESIAKKYIDLVNLSNFETKNIQELSGGMKQRVQLARTLAVNPEIIFMDEPFGALDPLTKNKLEDEIINIQNKEKKTIVLVTHDVESAVKLGDRIAVMSSRPGKIKKIIDVPLKKPRQKFDSEFIRIEKEIVSSLL